MKATSAGSAHPAPAVRGDGEGQNRRDVTCRSGFTLLEIIIALALIAILAAASLPYLLDSFAASAEERATQTIVNRAKEARLKAIETGQRQELELTAGGIAGTPLPEGWKLETQGLNDTRFHPPSRGETWSFNAAGICEPIRFRLSTGEGVGSRETILSFDPLTGQLLPDHDD